MPRFKPPEQRPRHDGQLTVHLPSTLRDEIHAVGALLGYKQKNAFYLHLLHEGLAVAKAEATAEAASESAKQG